MNGSKRVVALAALLTLVVAVAGGATVRATHWAGSVTDIVDNSTQTNPCHGLPYYFKTAFGWARTCGGGHDIASTTGASRVYIRGYFWNSASIVNAQPENLYSDKTCPAGQSVAAVEYNNAWLITVPTDPTIGTIGIGFHHLGNYHYLPGSPAVSRGTYVADVANWGALYPLYLCPNDGNPATIGPHVHTEAARDGNPTDADLVDSWRLVGPGNSYPFVRYDHP